MLLKRKHCKLAGDLFTNWFLRRTLISFVTQIALMIVSDVVGFIDKNFYPQMTKQLMQTVYCRNKPSLAT